MDPTWAGPWQYPAAARVKNALSIILAMNTYDIKKTVKHYNHKFCSDRRNDGKK